MTEDPVQQLCDYCDIAWEDLLRLKDQLSKVIAIKKNTSSDPSKMVLLKVEDVLKTIENLEKISSKLPKAIDDIKGLCQKVRMLTSHATRKKRES